MEQYKQFLWHILNEGMEKGDRTGTGTWSTFGYQMRYDLREGFPILTTKKVAFNAVVHELLWFIAGDTNIKYLVDNGVRIWNEWPYEKFKQSEYYNNETLEEFVEKIKECTEGTPTHKFGELGPVYGKQWRDFNGFDQLSWVINEIKTNPDSRRLIVNSWNPPQLKDMALPPCHMMFQFYVSDGELSLQLYQRSADAFLGVPFNITSYSLLLAMVAQVTGLKVGEFVHTIGDAHIYLDHFDQVRKQLSRDTLDLPQLWLNPEIKNIEDFKFDDIRLIEYQHHAPIRARVSV